MVDVLEQTAGAAPVPPRRRRAGFGRAALLIALVPGLAMALNALWPPAG